MAGGLRPGDVVLVAGEVGTGKTTFVRAAAQALGVREPIISPSFMIGRMYAADVPVSHVDLFRLDALEREDPALLSDYLGPETVVFVEWPEAAEGQLDPARVVLRVHLAHLRNDSRNLRAEGSSGLVERLDRALGGDPGR